MHTLIGYSLIETPDAVTRVVGVPSVGSGVSVAGQLTPVSSEQAFNATGIELVNAHLFLCDLEDATVFTANGNAVDENDREFQVRGLPKLWDAIPSLSCAEVYLELIEVTP